MQHLTELFKIKLNNKMYFVSVADNYIDRPSLIWPSPIRVFFHCIFCSAVFHHRVYKLTAIAIASFEIVK